MSPQPAHGRPVDDRGVRRLRGGLDARLVGERVAHARNGEKLDWPTAGAGRRGVQFRGRLQEPGEVTEVDAPAADVEDPVAGLHELMASTYAVLLGHPDLVPAYLARGGARGPNARRLGDVMLALLARVGLAEPDAREALRVLIVYTIGFAAFTTSSPLARDDAPQPPSRELIGNFDSGLRWLLAGIAGG